MLHVVRSKDVVLGGTYLMRVPERVNDSDWIRLEGTQLEVQAVAHQDGMVKVQWSEWSAMHVVALSPQAAAALALPTDESYFIQGHIVDASGEPVEVPAMQVEQVPARWLSPLA